LHNKSRAQAACDCIPLNQSTEWCCRWRACMGSPPYRLYRQPLYHTPHWKRWPALLKGLGQAEAVR
jgi:hypothetical protein